MRRTNECDYVLVDDPPHTAMQSARLRKLLSLPRQPL